MNDELPVTRYFAQVFGSYQLFSDTPAMEWAAMTFEAAKDLGLISSYEIQAIVRLTWVYEIHFEFVTTGISVDLPMREQATKLANEIVHDTDVVIKCAQVTAVKFEPEN